jgi:hypothetical protein
MPPYTEVQEPVTPTYGSQSDAKDMNNDGMLPSLVVTSDLPEPPFTYSPTEATNTEDRQPRRPRRRVKSMPVNSEGAQDFFASAATSGHRYERKGSAPQAFVSSKQDRLIFLSESDSIEEAAEEDAIEEPISVSRSVSEDLKVDAVKTEVDSTSPSCPNSSREPAPIKHQVDTACSCVIL